MAQIGIVATGLNQDAHSADRQRYRDGLDAFSQSSARHGNATADIRPPPRRMLTGAEHFTGSLDTTFADLQISPAASSIPLSLGPYMPQPPMIGTRYMQDFEELGVLGKGGYGIVYSCRHKLDGVIYAVKKVPISESRRQQIMIRGWPEINSLLGELRTLAQLDHPNIVRYFNGWLDWINLDADAGPTSSGSDDAVGGANQSRTGSISLGRVVTESGDDHILFEDSVSSSWRPFALDPDETWDEMSNLPNRYHERLQIAPHQKPVLAAALISTEYPRMPRTPPSVTKTSNRFHVTAKAACRRAPMASNSKRLALSSPCTCKWHSTQ